MRRIILVIEILSMLTNRYLQATYFDWEIHKYLHEADTKES